MKLHLSNDCIEKSLPKMTTSTHQISPFRYPGGKSWLVPRIRKWLTNLPFTPVEFYEPFAGGGIVGLTVALENLAGHVTMVELDEYVAAVWQTIVQDEGGAEWLVKRILNFTPTGDAVRELLEKTNLSTREQAFQTIVRNRVSRGGLLSPGSGLLKRGENGRGLFSRWYPETLCNRICTITRLRDRITFIQGDGFEVIQENVEHDDVVFFIDPPYTASEKRAGSRLYIHSNIDHIALFCLANQVRGDFLMTYDDSKEVRELAVTHRLKMELVDMRNTHHATLKELLIGKNMDWAIEAL